MLRNGNPTSGPGECRLSRSVIGASKDEIIYLDYAVAGVAFGLLVSVELALAGR